VGMLCGVQRLSNLPARVRGLCLFSGGLDSQLAVLVLREQGIDVTGVVFDSPFFDAPTAVAAARAIDLPLRVENFTRDIVALLDRPPHGFGKRLNPCVDCHARMLERAGQLMEVEGFDFLATGEVLNERPFSQTRGSLDVVAAGSGFGDHIVRPLSARLLPATAPERAGKVDRARLLDIQGRTLRRQLELAAHFGLQGFPPPAGGCRLTEPNYCRRLQDLRDHEGIDGEHCLELLRFGRHFRLSGQVKVVVGRHEQDNAEIEQRAELTDLLVKAADCPGPTGLLPNVASKTLVEQAAGICARYAGCPPGVPTRLIIRSSRGVREVITCPLPDDDCRALLV